MRNIFWTKFLNFLIMLLIVLLAVALLILPFLVQQYVDRMGMHLTNTLYITVFLYLTAIPFFILLIMLRRLCKNVLEKKPFILSSIRALNVISICAFVDFLLYAMGTFFLLKNLLSLTLMIAAFMIGLVSLILAQLFQTMMKIKQENDLTI
ncbi:DUF2975 domain-containing protein [Shimazuella sp. AN120528]|uniref:DUF2975 domain-containing protein n=1 Tax=Shimazuella soli TaxID=1892854 RepID=UPI001F0FEB71|nr:DUF2975 domain-containing protein [Shimazuella soli]MCH5585140.1 DUF2975 domain-containing protein [Shimazuella soli]